MGFDTDDNVLKLVHGGNFDTSTSGLTIASGGNVGIGTTTPAKTVDVNGDLTVNNNRLFIGNGSAALPSLAFAFDGNVGMYKPAADNIGLVTNGIEQVRIDQSGNVGIGTTSPSFPLEMGSGAHVTTGGVWTDASSRQYKENISNLTQEEAIDALATLNPVKFNYKAEKDEEYVGFIAEDVPDLVATKARKSLSPMDIVAVLTKVVQQQQQKIAELEARLNASQ